MTAGDYASLHPVFEIAFLAQNYPHESPELWDADHIVSHYTFAEKRTGEYPYSTIFIILAEIGRFDKSAEECVTARDRLFYWFRHGTEFTQMPDCSTIRSPKHSVLLDTRAKSYRATHHAFFIPLKHHRGEACHPKQLLSGDACHQVILSIREHLPSGDARYPKCLLSSVIYHPEALTIRRFLLLGDAYRKKVRMHLYWGHPLSSVIKDVLRRRFTSL